MREIGYGDVAVNKKMKILNKIFYDILLKIHSEKSNSFKANKNLIKKYLFSDIKNKDKFIVKIVKYFETFYDFCFVLDDDIMVEGKIDFKF